MRHLRVALILIAALVCASAQLMAGDVTQYRGGANRPGSASETIDLAAGQSALTELWSANTGTFAVMADPLVIGEQLILANVGGIVMSIGLNNGQSQWFVNLGEQIRATPSYGGGRIYVGTTEGSLVALDASTGDQLWRIFHRGQTMGSPAYVDGRLIVAHGFGNDTLAAYDAADGNVIWSRPLSRYSQGAPAIFGDRVVTLQPDGNIMAWMLSDGSPAWANPIVAQGIFYGTPPVVVQDPDSPDALVFALPGDEEVMSGSSIAGYQGYLIYRINLQTGTLAKVVPGATSSVAASSLPGQPLVQEYERAPARSWDDAPAELREELSRLTHLSSQLAVIEAYEQQWGTDFSALKAGLQQAHQKTESFRAEREAQNGSSAFKTMSTGPTPIPPSQFLTSWPTAGVSRPGAGAYMARGSNRFFAVMMREVPTISVEPRTIIFSLNPAMNGQLRWMYATDQLAGVSASSAPGTLLVGKSGDPNGAYLFAPLGSSVGVFDAAGNNTPLLQIDMQAPVHASVVVANGRLVVVDSSGYVRVLATENDPPSAPTVLTPAANAQLASLTSPVATWSAATDDSTAAGDLVYVVRYALEGWGSNEYVEMELTAGQTHFDFPGLSPDSMVTFAVRAKDSEGATGPLSATRTFGYLIDSTPPGAPSGLTLDAGANAISLNFAASPDHPESGASDVAGYRATVTGGSASFTIELGLNLAAVIDGNLVATPLVPGVVYTVSVVAVDRRGNLSSAVSGTVTPLSTEGPDLTPPTVVSAKLYDEDGNGTVEIVVLTFSEAISTLAGDLNVGGFALAGLAAVGHEPGPEGDSTFRLLFGAGVAGTGPHAFTFSSTFGRVTDVAGNLLEDFGPTAVSVTDLAQPVLLSGTLMLHDDSNDGSPNRLTVNFSEQIDPATVQAADLRVRTQDGTVIQPVSAQLLPGNVTLQLTLPGDTGNMGAPELELGDFNDDGTFLRDLAGNPFAGSLAAVPPTIEVLPGVLLRDFAPGRISFDASGSTASSPLGAPLSFEWRVTGWPSGSAQPEFLGHSGAVVSGQGLTAVSLVSVTAGQYSLLLTVTDATGGTASKSVPFSVNNVDPVVNAGADQRVAISRGQIMLDGRRSSDPNSTAEQSDIVAWGWSIVSQPVGATASIENATGPLATVSTSQLVAGRYVFRLTAQDTGGRQASDDVEVLLYSPENLPPTAVAGPNRRIALGQPLRLEGRFSRDDGSLSYQWSQIAGPSVILTSDGNSRATTVPALAGSYGFELRVTDGTFESRDRVWIEVFQPAGVRPPSLAPEVPQSATVGTAFSLVAAQAGGQAVLYSMTQLSGPLLIETSRESGGRVRSLLALAPGVAEIELTATDGGRNAVPVRRQIRIRAVDAPVANLNWTTSAIDAGGQVLNFSLNAPDGVSAHVLLQQTSGPVVDFGPLDATSFELLPAQSGQYVFQAIPVLDGQFGAPMTITMPVSLPGSSLPTAVPVVLSQSAGSVGATLSATQVSDLDGDTVGFLWTQIAGPVAVISDPEVQTTGVSFPDGSGQYGFELWIDDGVHLVSAGTVTLNASGTGVSGEGGGCAVLPGTVYWPLLAGLAVALMLLVASRRQCSRA